MILIAGLASCENSSPEESELPRIDLFYDAHDIDYDHKEYIETHIHWNKQHHMDMARAKFRGGWSQIYPKRSYTLNLQADPQLKALPDDNDWILSASYIDKTMLRHAYSFDLFRRMTDEASSAPSTHYVEVYVNHDYDGLYLLHPRMDRSFFDLGDDGSLFKDPPIFFSKELPPPEEPGNRFHQKYPKSEAKDHNEDLWHLRTVLMDTSLCDTSLVAEYFDLDNIRRWHILLLVTHGSDGLLKNFYLYRRDHSSPYKICIWDYDHSFGRDGDYELNRDTTVLDISRNWLLDGLMQCPHYRNALSQTYKKLRAEDILKTKDMTARLDSMYLELRPAIYRNGERWPWDSEHYSDDNNSDEEIQLIKVFIRNKMEQLDGYFEQLGGTK